MSFLVERSGHVVSLLGRIQSDCREKVFGGLVSALLGLLVFSMGSISPYCLGRWLLGLGVWIWYFAISDAQSNAISAIDARIVSFRTRKLVVCLFRSLYTSDRCIQPVSKDLLKGLGCFLAKLFCSAPFWCYFSPLQYVVEGFSLHACYCLGALSLVAIFLVHQSGVIGAFVQRTYSRGDAFLISFVLTLLFLKKALSLAEAAYTVVL